jgi:serine protease Do
MPPDIADLAARLLPSVVSVASTDPMNNNSDSDDDGGASTNPNQPPGGMQPTQTGDVTGASSSTVIPPPKAEEALGAGFIFDPAGYIATNNHVIDGATSVTVTLNDGTILPAKIVGQDKRGDLAVLKVDAGHPLPAVQFGDSSKLRVGDWVLAIGNPYGLDESSSAGIVSALHRDIGEDKYDDFIQTDATINRGNSGGPLFDIAGHVIGIDSAIYSPSGGSVGIGFAIPSAMVQPVVESLKATGAIKRGWLGISSQDVTPEIQKLLNLPSTSGALIAGVTAGGPSDSKLQPGDVLISLNGVAITNPRSLMIRTAQILSGQIANAEFWRDGSLQHAAITIGVPTPDQPPGVAPPPPVQPNINLASIGVAISPAPAANGLTVIAVTAGGPAAKAGLVADNTISAVGAESVTSAGALKDQLGDLANSHQTVAVMLVSGDDATGNDPGPRWIPISLAK